MLRFHHVAYCELWIFHERLSLAVRWRTGYTVTDCVYKNHEIITGINHVAGPDEWKQILGLTSNPSGPEHRVRLAAVQFTHRAIPQTEFMNYARSVKFEIAELGELLNPVTRRNLGGGRSA